MKRGINTALIVDYWTTTFPTVHIHLHSPSQSLEHGVKALEKMSISVLLIERQLEGTNRSRLRALKSPNAIKFSTTDSSIFFVPTTLGVGWGGELKVLDMIVSLF